MLEQTRWNRTVAAKKLGLSLRALRYRLEKFGVQTNSGQYCTFNISYTGTATSIDKITCTLTNVNPIIDTKTITHERNAATGTWTCKTTIAETKYWPGACES